MDKKPEKLVPEVRFKGFTDDWEQHKFDNVVKRINDKDDNPELPHIEFENIISGNGTLNKNIKELNSKKIGTKFQKEDIIFGKLRPYLKNWYFAKENGIAVGDFWVLRAKRISVFVYYLIQTEKFYSIANLSSGSKMPRSDWNLVSNSRFNFPENTIESIKIGNLILQLDKLITLQQRKLEQLTQLKKAMLQQLFIDKKSKQPNLRFKIFNGDWEQRKFLDEIDSIIDYRGKTPKKLGMSWSKTGYLALSALNVKNGWIDKKSKDSHFGSQALYDIWMKNTPLYKDQVVFTTEAPMGNVAQIPDNEKYILSQRTIAFNPSQRLIDGFLADLLSTKNIQNKLMSLATGGTAKGVSQKSLKFLKIAFPSNEEQNFIHKVIKLFQILITLQQNKLTQLTTLKKYLLQNLFI